MKDINANLGKNILASKTFWFNVVGLAAFTATAFGFDFLSDEGLQEQVVAGLVGVGNIVLRLFTKEPARLL